MIDENFLVGEQSYLSDMAKEVGLELFQFNNWAHARNAENNVTLNKCNAI